MSAVESNGHSRVDFVASKLTARLVERRTYLIFKRLFDVVACVAAAPAVALTLLVTALLVAVFMGRPIFFSQDRVGLRGRVFKMHKLRTMQSRSSPSGPVSATLVNDPRITNLGRFLRRLHLDELPQMWNIFRGDMTLIGPRPEQPCLVEKYKMALPEYDVRHSVVPGLSGWSQVRYGYAANLAETREKLRYDLYYLENVGLLIDLKIVALTVLVFMNRRYVR